MLKDFYALSKKKEGRNKKDAIESREQEKEEEEEER